MRKNRRYLQNLLGIVILWAMPGCQSEPSAATSVGSYAVLTQSERLEYLSDWKYMQGLPRPKGTRQLDLADPLQYRFLQRRMKVAGKNSQNSPAFFSALAAARKQHLELAARGISTSTAALSVDVDAGPVRSHRAEVAPGDTVMAIGDATVPGGTTYTYVDANLTDINGNPLAELAVREDYELGTDTTTHTDARAAAIEEAPYVGDSIEFDITGDAEGSEHYYSSYSCAKSQLPGMPTPKVVLGQPVDVTLDNQIKICLSRAHDDCDYNLLGMWELKVPFKGSIQIQGDGYALNKSAIAACKRDNQYCDFDGDQEIDGYISLQLTQTGGQCIPVNSAAVGGFWDGATVSADGKTLSWDMGNIDFGKNCQQVQAKVKFLTSVPIPVMTTEPPIVKTPYTLWLTTPGDLGNFTTCCPISITNSCFAAGTMIQMADGKQVPIEEVAKGERTARLAPGDQRALTVVDIAKGYEADPMIRIQDAMGRFLMMTSAHPMLTVDRGMVAAKYLKVGDIVATTTGPSTLVTVERKAYDGKVYNLFVGSQLEKAKLGPDDTILSANGFITGDGQVQAHHEAVELAMRSEGGVLQRLPARWHGDYLASVARKTAQLR